MNPYRGQDYYHDRGGRDYNRCYDSRISRRTFGSGYCRDDHNRGGGDCYEDKYDRYNDYS